MTCSFGIATFTEENNITTEVFNTADSALYKAKENGRDSIVVATDGELKTIALGTSANAEARASS